MENEFKNLKEEDIERIAKKVIELQNKNKEETNKKYRLCEIKKKYHNKLYKKFGPTGNIETHISCVVALICGVKTVSQIPDDRIEFAKEYMEKLYQHILKEE